MGQKKSLQTNIILCIAFILYIIIIGFAVFHHELWGDETHSWNIAKASGSFIQLIQNTRYEGHPPIWYIILWTISKFTNDPLYIQLVHILIALLAVYLLIYHSPLPMFAKLLVPFGYFFLYEYSVISRNYAIGVLLVFCVCIIMFKKFRGKNLVYYGLLLFLSNTHLLALMLAGCLHLYFLLLKYEKLKPLKPLLLHVVIGAMIFLPAAYFIFPPSDSGLNIDFWRGRWAAGNIKTFLQAPLRAFTPIPAWWIHNCWNTHFLMENQHGNDLLRHFNFILSLALTLSGIYFFRSNKKCLIFFITNFFLSFIIGIAVFPLIRERYTGFLLIGFIVALWLYYSESPNGKSKNWLLALLLLLQIPGGIIMITKDFHLPFSNAYRINDILKKVPLNEKVVTDYWTENAVNTFGSKPLYCIDLGGNIKFILWGKDLSAMLANPNRYVTGMNNTFEKEQSSKIYLVSIGSPEDISEVDDQFFKAFSVRLIDKIEGAINKGGNLYLYEVTLKQSE